MQKLTVTQIFKAPPPTLLIENPEAQRAFLTQNYIVLTTNVQLLLFNKHKFNFITSIKWIDYQQQKQSDKIREIVSVQQHNHQLFILINSSSFILVFYNNKVLKLSGHLREIVCMILVNNSLATASNDLIIRLWDLKTILKIREQQMSQDLLQASSYLLNGHTNKINCLQTYSNLLMSGSKDKTMIFWKGNKKFGQFSFDNQILLIKSCYQSQQLALYLLDNQILIVSMKEFFRSSQFAKIPSKFTIQKRIPSETKLILGIGQLDESFGVYTDGKQLYIYEIHLGVIVKKIAIESINSMFNAGKVVFLLQRQRGLSMIKF